MRSLLEKYNIIYNIMKRCRNGTRRNKKTGKCFSSKHRCPPGKRRNKITLRCRKIRK
jgi:hypothetical protein